MSLSKILVTLGIAAATLGLISGCASSSKGAEADNTAAAVKGDKLTTPKPNRRTWSIYWLDPAIPTTHIEKGDAFRLRKDGQSDYKLRPVFDLKDRWGINQVKLGYYSTGTDDILCGVINKPGDHLDGHMLTITLDRSNDDNAQLDIEENGTCGSTGIPGGGGRVMN